MNKVKAVLSDFAVNDEIAIKGIVLMTRFLAKNRPIDGRKM